MKKKLVLALGIFAATFALSTESVKAQDGRGERQQQNLTPAQRVDNQIQRWTKALSLSSDQVNQIKPLLLELNQKREAMRDASDKRAAMREMRDLVTAQDAKMKTILSAEQYTKYEDIKDEAKDRMKGKFGGRN
jgi:Na+-transporting NADH:ubiquinone oxidoreductase subunit NqrC